MSDGGVPWNDIPKLDEDFVTRAKHWEPSAREREEGPQGQPGGRRPSRPPPPPGSPSRSRKIIGVAITVAVLVAAYVPTRFLGGHGTSSLLQPYLGPNTSCSSFKYPSGSEYRFEGCVDKQPVRWPRCATLTYSVNAANAPAAWRNDVGFALNLLTSVTGLKWRQLARGGDITMAWSPTLLSPKKGARDVLGVTALDIEPKLVGFSLRSAAITVSSRLTGGGSPTGEVPVLLHELGHAVGMGHFNGPEVMNPIDQGYDTYQKGDLAGLDALYSRADCP